MVRATIHELVRGLRGGALPFAVAVLAARIAFLYLSPWELVADEAHYWEWSRRLEPSYYSKGPGVAWVIAFTTAFLGDREWAIRLPAAVVAFIATVALARLASQVSDGDGRAGFFAAVAFTVFYQPFAVFMTTDGPTLACWVLAVCAARALFRRQERRGARVVDWLPLSLALGVGFLFKYASVLLVPGLVAYAILDRRRLRWNSASLAGLGIAIALVLAIVTPVLVWNFRHGWPTVIHLIGNIGFPGGDRPVEPWDPLALPWFFLSQLAILGPAAVLIGIAANDLVRGRDYEERGRSDAILMLCAAVPILVFYVAIATVSKVQANWPLAGYATLLVLVARRLARDSRDHTPSTGVRTASFSAWRARWHRGQLPASTPFRRGWRAWMAYALVPVAVVIALGVVMPGRRATAFLPPAAGDAVAAIWDKLAARVSGSRERAGRIDRVLQHARRTTGDELIIVADGYGRASLLAYYLPGHPRVYSAASLWGDRQSAYDYFPDTNLFAPELFDRPALLVGGNRRLWDAVLRFERIDEMLDGPAPIALGRGYCGAKLTAQRNGAQTASSAWPRPASPTPPLAVGCAAQVRGSAQ